MRVYFDNAATTPLDKEVFDTMAPYMLEHFGNPSSIHFHGREVRSAIEKSRKTVAELLNASPSEIFFTSGGTEADNTALRSSIETYSIENAISSPIEHHAVLHTLEMMEKLGKVKLHFVELDNKGNINMDHLRELLKNNRKCLVSLMHANNEIGNLNDLNAISELCTEYKAVFHSDTVQTTGHYRHDLKKLDICSMVGSSHKFHGPKGIGFLYVSTNNKISPLLYGGAQERNMRGGTENVYGIIGLAKALEIAYREMDAHRKHIETVKKRMIDQLMAQVPGVEFNGESANFERSLYTVLNVSLPESEMNDMLLFNLDINKISASGGSACTSGSQVGSHVLRALNVNPERANVRFSFSKYNTVEEVDYVVGVLAGLFNKVEA
jgi:cysteine desulfurase